MGTQEIVDHTGLRQPEVSVGMRMLRDRGWADAEAVPRDGKGRPMHKYMLLAKGQSIKQHYGEMGQQAIQSYESAISTLDGALSQL